MTLECKNIISTEEAIELDLKVFNAIKAYKLQSLNQVGVDVIVDRLNLEPFYDHLHTFNHITNLYHNIYHAHCVLLNCYEGAYQLQLDEETIRGLCVGALLHDFNHSCGELPDSENIKFALIGLENAQKYANSQHLGLSARSLEIARSVIKITQYPYIVEPTIIPEQIIRDADLMQAYEESPKKVVKQFLGLKSELEVKGNKLTNADFARGTKAFYDAIQWNTRWATEKAYVRNFEMIKANLVKMLTES